MMTKGVPPPYLPAKYELADVAAIQALVRGNATPEQQTRAITFIVNDVCSTYDLEYRTDARDHAFGSGRRFSGLQIVKMIKLNLAVLNEDHKPTKDE
jgi:hypothetical protein